MLNHLETTKETQMSNGQKVVSIIVPIYNLKTYLYRCVDSILNQTYKQIEVILVDDGSSDGSNEICERYATKDKRVNVVHKHNGGLSDARNVGLNIATGDYITFIDGDDWYDNNAISKLVDGFTNDAVGVCYMGMNNVNKELMVVGQDYNTPCISNSKEFIFKVCNGLVGTSVCSKMFSRKIIAEQRFKTGRLNEDFLFLNSVLLDFDILVNTIDYNGYYYYSRENSITHSINKKSILDAIDNCDDLYLKALDKQDYDILSYFARTALHQSYVALVVNPEYKLYKKSLFYIKSTKTIKKYFAYVLSVQLPKREKIICFLARIFPFFIAFVVNKIYRIKNNI